MAFDINNPDDLLALKTEVNTDPQSYGYVPENTQDGVLDIVNLKRAAITVSKPRISSDDVKNLTTYDAFEGLLTPEENWLQWRTASAQTGVDDLMVTPDLREKLVGPDSIWAAADDDAMEPLMLALIDVDGSRAEELFGYGTTISRNDWFAARDS